MHIFFSINIHLSLGNSLLKSKSLLLLQNHDLESLKVGQVSSSLSLLDLLSPCRFVPLLFDSSPSLSDSSRASSSGKLGDDVRGQNNVAEGNSLSRNASLRTVNENLKESC